MTETPEKQDPSAIDEPAPLGSWNRMYAVVLGVLLVEIVLFSLFTWAFR